MIFYRIYQILFMLPVLLSALADFIRASPANF